jgi:hypothetical protein
LQRLGAVGRDLGAALLWCQGGQVACFALTPPSAQRGGVNALLAHQRTDFAGAGAALGGIQNVALSALENCRRRACGTTSAAAAAADDSCGGNDALASSVALRAPCEASASEELLTACTATLG